VLFMSRFAPIASTAEDAVDLRPLKALAQNMLPPTSSARLIISSLPDSLPRREAVAKVEVVITLLHCEFR